MEKRHVQILVWALVPVLGFLLLVTVLLARGGWLAVIPISLVGIIGCVLYILWMRAPKRGE